VPLRRLAFTEVRWLSKVAESLEEREVATPVYRLQHSFVEALPLCGSGRYGLDDGDIRVGSMRTGVQVAALVLSTPGPFQCIPSCRFSNLRSDTQPTRLHHSFCGSWGRPTLCRWKSSPHFVRETARFCGGGFLEANRGKKAPIHWVSLSRPRQDPRKRAAVPKQQEKFQSR
jgi:hypothetical protein